MANNLLKKKSVIYDKDTGGVYKKKLRKIFTSTDPEMNPLTHTSSSHDNSDSFSSLLLENNILNNNLNGSSSSHEHHDTTVKPYYNIGEVVSFRERSQSVDQIGFVYHKKASSLHEKERIPKCVVYMLSDEKYWVLEWLLLKENNIEVGERTFESNEKSSPPPLSTSNNNSNNNPSMSANNNNNLNTSKCNGNLMNNIVSHNLIGGSNNNNMDILPNSASNHATSSNNNSLITSRFGHHHTQNGNIPNGFLNSNGHAYHGISKTNKQHNGSSLQLTQHLTSLLSSLDSKYSNNSLYDNSMQMDEDDSIQSSHNHGIQQQLTEKRIMHDPFSIPSSSSININEQQPQPATNNTRITTINPRSNAFHSSTQSQQNSSPPSSTQLSTEVKDLLLSHPFLSQQQVQTKNSNNNGSVAPSSTTHRGNSNNNQLGVNSSQPLSRVGSSSSIAAGVSQSTTNNINSSLAVGSINSNNNNNNNNNNNMEKLAQPQQYNMFNTSNNNNGNVDTSMLASSNGLHHPMNSMRRIPSNSSIGNMNQLFNNDANDATSQMKKQMVLNHIQQRQQLVNQQLMELLNQQNRRPSFSIPSSKYDLNLLNISNNYQYNISPSFGTYSQPAIVSFNHNFELRPTDMLQFLLIQVKDGQNLKASCVNPVISYDNDTLVALNDLSNRVALSSNGNIPNLDEELSKFVHSSPLLVTLPPQEEPGNLLIVLMKNFIPITSPLLFEYSP